MGGRPGPPPVDDAAGAAVPRPRRWPRPAALAMALLVTGLALRAWAVPAAPQPLPGSGDCIMCHEAGRNPKRIPGEAPRFDASALRASPHADIPCSGCHQDLEGKELPHEAKLRRVDCSACHIQEGQQHDESRHGVAAARGERLAPTCKSCHGGHEVLRVKDPRAPTYPVNIPVMCNSCHREGSPVQSFYHIPQDSILANYSESIHGEGLFRKGLLTTATCISCHTAHHQLPHTDPRSSIARQNIAQTCEQCHVRIEEVHRKVVRGELWSKQGRVPACVDCHEPHKIRRVFYTQGMADADCMACHSKRDLTGTRDGRPVSMYVARDTLAGSRHARVACAQCHTGASPGAHRPCNTMGGKVDCSTCHAEVVATYNRSIHGQLAAKQSPDAPRCADCHGTHGIKGHAEVGSPTYANKIPALCGSCHRTGNKASTRYTGTQQHIVESYEESIHGKGLLRSGLVVTATCADCHTAHGELPKKDPASSVHPANVATTCANCHRGIYEQFEASIHSPAVSRNLRKGERLPVCSDCHSAHQISRADKADFRLEIMTQCGQCHSKLAATYFETYHGKVSKLGYDATAKCYDCHGAHDILSAGDPRSHLSKQNVVATCRSCHPGSNVQFAGYLAHATHHDHPVLSFTFYFMTTLLVGTFLVAGLHTLAWLPRSLAYRRQLQVEHALESPMSYRRFPKLYRNLHIMVIVSFIALALTGMMLKFSHTGWAFWLARLLGGFEAAGFIHRLGAILTFSYFALHLRDVFRRKGESRKSWREFILGRDGMMFGPTDLQEFVGSFKWFLGRGPRPRYGRWTYWEKFDYFAVFWGVAIIGSTGLVLWFPTFFTRFLPGWAINVANIIHSDEALLAVGFIFTIHFFNTHFRPEKFPMDTVIFTGTIPLDEFKKDRPREYEEMVRSGRLEERLEPTPTEDTVRRWRVFGWIALSFGILLVLAIISVVFFGYLKGPGQ